MFTNIYLFKKDTNNQRYVEKIRKLRIQLFSKFNCEKLFRIYELTGIIKTLTKI